MASFHGASFHGASFHGASFQGARQRIVTLVREADRLPLTKAWSKLGEIQDLEAPENTKLKALQAAAEDSGAVGKLIVARSYLDLDEEGVFGTKAVELVGPILLGSGPQEQRIAAATILGDKDLRTTARGKARKVLEQIVRDDTSEQTVRLTAAKSLFNAGNSRMARSMLLEFYESADRQLRIEGALALAEIGDLRSVRPILEEIERQPSVAGRLARAYLDKEKQQHFFDLMLKDLRKQLDNQETNRSNGNRTNRRDKLFVLRQLMGMVRRLHIEGDEIREEQLVDAAAKGMLRSVDRFSSYLTSDEYKRFAFDLNRDYGGIGAYVNNPDGRFQITRPIYSGPAYRQGLMSGDRILEVDGWETTDQELSEIIRRLKGKPGTPVTVKVWRAGWPEPKDYTLPRAVIQLPSVSTLLLP
ncbi:MAG: PDZ domain-containing protein, partial [Planctomycetota bacterium]